MTRHITRQLCGNCKSPNVYLRPICHWDAFTQSWKPNWNEAYSYCPDCESDNPETVPIYSETPPDSLSSEVIKNKTAPDPTAYAIFFTIKHPENFENEPEAMTDHAVWFDSFDNAANHYVKLEDEQSDLYCSVLAKNASQEKVIEEEFVTWSFLDLYWQHYEKSEYQKFQNNSSLWIGSIIDSTDYD